VLEFLFVAYPEQGDNMSNSCDPLALTTAINTLAVAIAETLSDDDLSLTAAMLTQLGDTLATIAVQRDVCKDPSERV
jgi:hypothetical protein